MVPDRFLRVNVYTEIDLIESVSLLSSLKTLALMAFPTHIELFPILKPSYTASALFSPPF